jgi:GTPase SAR1 family protein
MIVYKILLFGGTTVGKTAFILSFWENKFEEGSLTAIGEDIKTKFLTRQDKKI